MSLPVESYFWNFCVSFGETLEPRKNGKKLALQIKSISRPYFFYLYSFMCLSITILDKIKSIRYNS